LELCAIFLKDPLQSNEFYLKISTFDLENIDEHQFHSPNPHQYISPTFFHYQPKSHHLKINSILEITLAII
jgi:hypothetical protein